MLEPTNGESSSSKATTRRRPRGRSDQGSNPTTSPPQTRSPLQVIFPSPLANDDATVESTSSSQSPVRYQERPVSLRRALQWMRQAVATLRLAADENGEDGSPLLRLEQRIHTSTTDPLAWLDWQIHYLPTKCDSPMEDAPLMYFGNQEGTTEAAVLGSLAVTHDTADIWELPLPLATRWYGGEAFDGTQGRSQEWEAYGAAWWILPAVEIKRDHEVTTLSVHVQADALAYLQDLLQAIDHQQSERRSPTTLPPILSRDGRLQSARGQVQDSQDLYEQAVSAALPLLSDDQCDLQKVVLARSQHLHFNKTVSIL